LLLAARSALACAACLLCAAPVFPPEDSAADAAIAAAAKIGRAVPRQPVVELRSLQRPTFGAGSLQFQGFSNSYLTRQDGAGIQSNLGLITPINDWPVNQSQFAQLTYTHSLPGNRVLISIGQYPTVDFDGNQYLGNSQQNEPLAKSCGRAELSGLNDANGVSVAGK